MRFLRSPPFAGSRDQTRRRSRWRSVILWIFGGLLVLLAVVAMATLVLTHSLDRPWVKRRLQAVARMRAGVEIDYRSARIDLLSGADIEGLVVQSPAEFRPFAADLVRIGRVQAHWSPRSLLGGHGPVIERVSVSDVAFVAVIDDHGRTSFDAFRSSGPTVPLSRRASSFLETAPLLGELSVDPVTLVLVRTERGEVSERIELRGIAVALATSSAEPTTRGWRLRGGLGSPAAPLDVVLTRTRQGGSAAAARANLWVTVDATSSALDAALDLRMIQQTFSPSVSADHWLHAEAKLRFDPIAGRTEVAIERAEAGDGAAIAEASIEVPDDGDPMVRSAHGDIDVARLLRWLPAGLIPITAERAQLRYQIRSAVAGPVVRLSEGGAVDVDVDLSNAALVPPYGELRVGTGTLSLQAEPAPGGGMASRGSMKVGELMFASGANRLAADDLAVDLQGKEGADGAIAATLGMRVGRVDLGPTPSAIARDCHVELHVEGLYPNADEPTATRGDIGLSFDLASLEVRSSDTRAIVDGLRLHAHAALEGHAPYAAELEAPASRLRVIGRDGGLLLDVPARLEAHASDVQPDVADPAASRGTVRAAVDLGEMRVSLDATKDADAIDFAIGAAARSLKAIRSALPAELRDRAPWDRMAVTARSSGRIDHLRGRTAVRETTEIRVEHPAFENVAMRSLSLTVRSLGTASHHQLDAELGAHGLAVDGGSPLDDHVTLSATVDRERPSLQFRLASDGRASARLSGSLSFDPSRRGIAYAIDGNLAGLAPLAPLAARMHRVDAFDLSRLEAGLSAHGVLLGVVTGIAGDGTIRLEPSPALTAAVEGTTDLRVAHFRWAKGTTAVEAPALAWHVDSHASGARRTLDSRVEVGTMHVDLGTDDVDLNGIRDEASVAIVGNLADPEIELTQRLSVRAVAQGVLPEYPMGAVAMALSAERGHEGVVHISDMRFANELGGTALRVSGNVDVSDGRHGLSVTTSVTQDLAFLSTIAERFTGRGKVTLEANVTSPDFVHYNVRAALKGEDVAVTLPRAGIDLERANGDVPISEAFELRENGVALEHKEKRSPYAMLRFADQHPLLNRSGFLSIARLKTPYVSIAPLVGNLAIEQNVVSLQQFEMGVRGGLVTGQCGVDWDGPRSTLELHVRASGVQSSHGEPFDGNIAVAISAADRTIDGRAEILRIGGRHLLDLLDLQDPLHVDPAMNRIRTALVFGHPESLRLVFDHGFASARLKLGGLARLISIDELRGIPMGPIVDKMIAPMFLGPDTKEPQ